MKSMTVPELYEYLRSEQFLKGDGMFYNYYIYQYPANKEYEMRNQILEFKEKLERPTTFVDALVLDLFKVFCEYLANEKFGDKSLLEDTLDEDKTDPISVAEELTQEANSDEFIKYIHDKIVNYINSNNGYKHPYVFMHGIGKMFPYLRTRSFLTQYEKYNDTSKYKIIVFYPGHQEERSNSFSLFDTLEDDHTYRATLLVNK